MSDFYITDICTSDLCPCSNSQIGVQFPNLWSFLTFSNRCPMTSLAYALILTLTNKSAIDRRIWKGRRFEHSLKSDCDLRQQRWWMLILRVHTDLSPEANLSLSYLLYLYIKLQLDDFGVQRMKLILKTL